MYLKHLPNIVKPFARDLIFDLPNDQQTIYLTFDDGPHPEITPEVLDLLQKYNAKATFFLVGQQAERFPKVVDQIRSEGHAIGRHGYAHLSGWRTKNKRYFDDFDRCANVIESNLFRPPYGQITFSQVAKLKSSSHIVMWSHLSADWDKRYSAEQCFGFATEQIKPGSIVVFHDSEKAKQRVLTSLALSLEVYQNLGLNMKAIALPTISPQAL